MLPTSYLFTRCVVGVMYDDGIRGINVGAAQRELFFAIVSLQKMPLLNKNDGQLVWRQHRHNSELINARINQKMQVGAKMSISTITTKPNLIVIG